VNFSYKNIRLAPILLTLLSSPPSYSQELREEAIKNIGSSIAYLALCEKEKLMTETYVSKLTLSTQKNLGKNTYERIRDQYQKSLHEKKQYSISADKWIPMKVNKTNCEDLEKSAPILLNHINEIGKSYPKNSK
jgi:F0F1-type ATP synthase beta subunit